DTKKFIQELSTSAADTLAMIATIGDSLLRGIKCRIATLKRQLESEHSSKLEKLQLVARELEAPQQLYQQMKMLLQHHANAVQFLHERKRLKREMVRLMEGSMSPQIPIKDTISIRRYFQELIRGIDITAFVPPETDQVLASAAGLREAWQAGCATQGRLSPQVLEDILCKAASGSSSNKRQGADKAAQRGAGPAAALQWGPGQHCSAEAKGRCKRQSNGPANEFTRCSRARPCVRLPTPALPSLKPPRPASPRLHPGPRVRVSGGGGCEGRAISAEGGGGGGRRSPPRS
ncbi:hypothetical protein EI555_009755, partial [Monodon monoceros]